MNEGFSFTSAEHMINRIEDEQRRTLFGREEKNLICNYAFHVGYSDKVEQLAETLAAQRFEVQHGYLNPAATDKIKAEISHIDGVWATQATPPDNYLKTAEMGAEQNYNQIDGTLNNQEPPRVNQGYVILESEIIGHMEFVLAENKNAPQPFVTWQRNIQNDEGRGEDNWFWGHYAVSEESARDDFHTRVKEARDDFLDDHPSIRAQLKEHAAQTETKPTAQEHKKNARER